MFDEQMGLQITESNNYKMLLINYSDKLIKHKYYYF